MSTDRQLLEQALAALESCDVNDGHKGVTQHYDEAQVEAAIAALRARLDQPMQEGERINIHLLWRSACEEWGNAAGGPAEYEIFAEKLTAALASQGTPRMPCRPVDLIDDFYNGTAEQDWPSWGEEAVNVLERIPAVSQGTAPLEQPQPDVHPVAGASSGASTVPAVPPEIADIIERLHTQDNRITDNPLFAVQQKRRIYGLDADYRDGAVFVDDEGIEFAERDSVENGCREVGYRDTWEFVTGCFTEQGCKDYIAVNGHNLHEPRIYAYGSYRNAEFIALRKWLMGLRDASSRKSAAGDQGSNVQDLTASARLSQLEDENDARAEAIKHLEEVVEAAHSYLRGSLRLPEDAPRRFDYYAQRIAQLEALLEKAREALRLYGQAGYGNSTDHYKQGQAYDASIEAIAAIDAALGKEKPQ